MSVMPAPKRPILFGGDASQRFLITAYLDGESPAHDWHSYALFKTGLVYTYKRDGKWKCALDPRHPAHRELCELLRDLTGADAAEVLKPAPTERCALSPERPLAHLGPIPFRLLFRIARAKRGMTAEQIRSEMPDLWPAALLVALEDLHADGIFKMTPGGRFLFARTVPQSYVRFVLRVGEALLPQNPRLRIPKHAAGRRVAAFNQSEDDAPLVFGTDTRLRNLMALAKYGPLHVRDLRRITSVWHLRGEAKDHAPFGRGGLVREWDTDEGPAAMLDPDYPLADPLRRLLLRMEKAYPLADFTPLRPAPEPPPRTKWRGDRFALFGSPIPTIVLTSIAAMGWTFERLCDDLCDGYDRVVVKKCIRRLEERDGILQGDRERRPGMNVRVVTISDKFPAREELLQLINAYADYWPSVRVNVKTEMKGLTYKTKQHLRGRGLFPY